MPNLESKTKQIISEEWRFLISVVAPIVAIVLSWGLMQTRQAVMEERLDKIQNNELIHVAASLGRIEISLTNMKVDIMETKTLLQQHLIQK